FGYQRSHSCILAERVRGGLACLHRLAVGQHRFVVVFCFLSIGRPPTSTLFPYTTLFRSKCARRSAEQCLAKLGKPSATGCRPSRDRKSTRLNSSHVAISYAVFCLKKKKCGARIRLAGRRSGPAG